MIKLIFFIIFLIGGVGNGIAQNFNIGAGISYGGPIPIEVIDSTSGRPLVGMIAGISYSFPINERILFTPGLYYSFRGLDYSQSYTRDTLLTFDINETTAQVPSFYTAYASGKMRLHYIDIPLLIEFNIWKFQMMLGPYFSILLAGKDAGNVRVVVGYGGFADDYHEDFNNYSSLRKIEHGFMLGSKAPIYRNLSIEMKVSRSFFTLYNLNKLKDNGQGIVKMYNTYVNLGLIYKLKRG